jgi:predicted acyltransferase
MALKVELTTQATSIMDTDNRVLSVDFFRGVVMFFLIAEATCLYGLLVMPAFKDTFIHTVGLQFSHHPWSGMRLWDFGQPFFMLISVVAMYFSYNRRWEMGERWGSTFTHALRRSLLLFILGWAIYLIVPVEGNSHGAFVYDVLPHLAVANFVAFLVLRRPVFQQLSIAFGFIAVSNLLYRLWAVPRYD